MKNFKPISILIFAMTIISALAISTSAKWWDDNPFIDVKSSHWYYDAVRITNENGIFNGTTADKFTPNGKMTRAMLVQALASADGFNKDDYKYSNTFKDVKSSHWFAPAVEWAYRNNITSGKTLDNFAPNDNITREQLAAMLCRYAEYKGMEITNTKDISSFPDSSKVSSYAVKNFEWAYGNGIINGSVKADGVYLNPRNPATRAECATMFSKYLYLKPTYEINGNDLSLYTIVYSDKEIDSVEQAANDLSKYIEQSLGIVLPVVTDETPANEYEILVGKTNRFDIDLTSLDADTKFICTVKGNKLVIIGTDDSTEFNRKGDITHHNIDGSKNAVYYLLEKKFGFDFYYDGEGIVSTPDPVISLNNGYEYIDGPAFESVGMYIDDDGAECYLHNGYYEEWGCGLPHQLGNLMMYGESSTDNTWGNPCYSDPDNIEKLITNVRALLERNPDLNLVGLIQNDSDSFCKCDECDAIYRKDGRAGTLMRLVNKVAETFEEEYPGLRFATWAYGWSATPPKSDLRYHDNVILYYNTIALCPCHEYTDTTCKGNKNSASTVKTWSEKASKLYLWEHTGSFGDAMVPAQDLDSIRANALYLYENGVRGVFLNGRGGNTSDMYGLRAYLFTQVYRDPMMSEEEYYYRMNGFLKTFYGDGYTYIRQYIDKLCDISDQQCTGTHADITGMYNFELVCKAGEELNILWDKAEAAAQSQTYLDRVKMYRLSWTYLWQSARYESEYTNGTASQREAYKAISSKLYDEILHYAVKWDGFEEQPSGDLTKPPYQW